MQIRFFKTLILIFTSFSKLILSLRKLALHPFTTAIPLKIITEKIPLFPAKAENKNQIMSKFNGNAVVDLGRLQMGY
jgi:hypothetical protein